MAHIRNTTSVHESTVKKVAANKTAKPKRRRRTARHYTFVAVRVWPDSVNELIVDYVVSNKIDIRRIEIVGEDEIIIHNPK